MLIKRMIYGLSALLLLILIAVAAQKMIGNSEAETTNTVSGITRVAFTDLPHGWPIQAIPVGDQLLLSNGETFRGLQRIDWRDADKPRLAQSFDTGNTNGSLVKLGKRIYQLANYYGISMFDMADDGTLKHLGRWHMPPPIDHGRRMVGLKLGDQHYLYLHIKPEGNWKDWPEHPKGSKPGLYLLDVTDTKNVQVRYLGKRPLFSKIKANYGFVLNDRFLEIYSLKEPAYPRLLGNYQATGKILDASIDGAHLWLNIGGRSVEILDISNPAHPLMLARSDAKKMQRTSFIVAQGAWAYVLETSGRDRALHVFHWQDGVLQHVRRMRWPHTKLQQLVLAGNTAYAIDGYYGVWRVDMSQPDEPALGTPYMSAGEIQQLLIDGPMALANLEWGGTVALLDVSDPLHIQIKGYYRPGRFDDYAVAVMRPYFYYGKGRVRRIIDASDPAHPVEVGTWNLQGRPLMPPVKWKNHMFQWLHAGKQGLKLVAYDMQKPLYPASQGILTMPTESAFGFGASATDGTRLFAVADNAIVAIDVSNPAQMRLLGTYREAGIGRRAKYTWQGAGRRAALAGDYLYVIQGSEALDAPHIVVLDVSNPQHMRKVYATPVTPPAFQDDWFDSRLLHQGDMFNDMFIRGNSLYVCDYWGGLRVYNLDTPFRPTLKIWEFQPYLALMPKNWNRQRYNEALQSGDLHKDLALNAETWGKRLAIGKKLWNQQLVYHPGYELFAWNVGGFAGNYLLQPKLGGIAVYHFPTDKTKP
ncbi:MAG: hypothetical protein Q9M25_01385 [Mariprofundaceae bacterium]|nr:hypothetical protein [Mariprofundaceae bacterium]